MKNLLTTLSILLIATASYAQPSPYAEDIDRYIDNASQYIKLGEYKEALKVVHEGLNKYPKILGLNGILGEIYLKRGNYIRAIEIFDTILYTINQLGEEAPTYHSMILHAYNELGKKYYFSEELCLRLIYHAERYYELEPEFGKAEESIEFLNQTLDFYGAAKAGARIFDDGGGDRQEFILPQDLVLPPHYVDDDKKLIYKKKAEQRVADSNRGE